MPTYLDPISTISTAWTVATGTPHSEQIDDAVRQPTDPGTSTYVKADFMDGSPATLEVGLTASSSGEITEITTWLNVENEGPGPSLDVGLKIGGSYTANQTISGVSPRAWASKTFNATSDPGLFPIAASTAINLRMQATGAGPGTRNAVYEAYALITLSAAPEINIKGNGVSITNGDSSPSVSDDTDFGTIEKTSTVSKIFTIENIGTADLALSGTPKVSLSGSGSAYFSVTDQPVSPIASSGSDTFTVLFDPDSNVLSNSTVTVSIANDDADENPYTFDIQATSVTAPSVNVGADLNHTVGTLLDLSGLITVTAGTGQVNTWTVETVPTGGNAVFNDATVEEPVVGFTLPGTYTLKLSVTDDTTLSDFDTLDIVVAAASGGVISRMGNLGRLA